MSEAKSSQTWQSFGIAMAIEVGLVTIALAVLGGSLTPSVKSEPVTITIAPEDPPPVVEPPKPLTPPPPVPTPKPKVVEHKPIVQPPTPTPPVLSNSTPLPIAATPTAFSEPAPPPPPPPPPPVPSGEGKPDPIAAYATKVLQAVEAAHSYPPAALALKFEGKVRVEFHLKDRVPSAARVVVSSNIGMIDRAALQAVQNANYAEPPPELQGKDHIFVGNVAFYLPRN